MKSNNNNNDILAISREVCSSFTESINRNNGRNNDTPISATSFFYFEIAPRLNNPKNKRNYEQVLEDANNLWHKRQSQENSNFNFWKVLDQELSNTRNCETPEFPGFFQVMSCNSVPLNFNLFKKAVSLYRIAYNYKTEDKVHIVLARTRDSYGRNILHYVCKALFSKIEDEMEDGNKKTKLTSNDLKLYLALTKGPDPKNPKSTESRSYGRYKNLAKELDSYQQQPADCMEDFYELLSGKI